MNTYQCKLRGWKQVGSCGLALALTIAGARATPVQTQSIQLAPGWNAIYLEVTPTNAAMDAVFAGVPLVSVWTFRTRLASVSFIQDPTEPVWNRDSWLVYVPTNRPESIQNSLFAVAANSTYLVRITGSLPVTLQVTGRPSLRRPDWVPDAYNLRGFPIDLAAPPTFQTFFAPSPAHFDKTTSTLRRIYRLNSGGQWGLVAPGDTMRQGEAYWVYTKGASDYVAPVIVQSSLGDGLDYGYDAGELSLRLRNVAGSSRTLAISNSAALAGALAYAQTDPIVGVQWLDLPATLSHSSASGADESLRLSVRRANFSASVYETVLVIRDGAGTRFLVPVSARTVATGGTAGGSSPHDEAKTHAGLWIGTASINAVSEAHSGNLVTNQTAGFTVAVDPDTGLTDAVPNSITRTNVSMTPTPTKTEFVLRVLLHVDANGQTRLLKEAIQMWQNGVYTNDASGVQTIAAPGRNVLLTEDSLITQFQGATVKDGESVGRRLSTADFDFPAGSNGNFVEMSGDFAIGSTVSCAIALSPDFPTNPFRHKYHPDHASGFGVTRSLSFTFAPAVSASDADYGYSQLAGTYQESLEGLHRNAIAVSGTFQLRRISTTAVLNQ